MISRLTARFPTLTASLFYAVAVLLAFNRFFAGEVLLSAYSDQRNGYPPRLFAAEYFKEFGSIPEWSPYIFGGFPFTANTGFGDSFFPTALLRLIMPVDQGMALGFMVFVFLAGVFAFLFLRGLKLSWGASFVGGAAYMFTGMLLSMTSPGHDGKLFVSAMSPLALMFLYKAVKQGDWRQYLYFGVTVGFCLLTPHFQATYYLLMASGFFWFFMVFLSKEKAETESWWRAGLLFGAALLVGFAMAAVQLLPFMDYLPYSPRGAQEGMSRGWDYAVSYSMPPEEIIGAFLPGFNGSDVPDHYFGRNFFKLHSEYFGVVAILLALASFRLAGRQRMAWFFVFLATYAAIFAFGGHTPFYGIPYTILPGINKTRAPSIIFFLASLSASVLAAFGTEYLLSRGTAAVDSVKKEARKAAKQVSVQTGPLLQQLDRRILYGMAALIVIALLATIGGLRPMMESIARNIPPMPPEQAQEVLTTKAAALDKNYPVFVRHLWIALILATGATALLLPSVSKKLGRETAGLFLGLIVLADLYAFESTYIRWSPRASEIMARDEVVSLLTADTTLHRVMPIPNIMGADTYVDKTYFMAHRVRTAFGHNGFELHAYDQLLGGKNSWLAPQPWLSSPRVFEPKLWHLLGVKYVVLTAPGYPPADSIPPQLQPLFKSFWGSLVKVGDSLRTYDGTTAAVYRVTDALPYAFLVPSAVKLDGEMDAVISAALSPQVDVRGLLLVPKDSPVGSDAVSAMGAPIVNPVSAHEVRPGNLHFELERPAESDAFLYVAENYYPSWHAMVDGASAPVVRAQVALMAVPIKAGAKVVDLEFSMAAYHRGRLISLGTLAVVLIIAVLAWVQARRKGSAV